MESSCGAIAGGVVACALAALPITAHSMAATHAVRFE
jgi:hypothetical protein